jgi:AcrR family transcriptional regulator
MSGEPSSLRERKKLRTRQALGDAAMRLFLERGYQATTVADIAAAAEVSPRTFFAYFPAKEDVLFADSRHRVERLRAALARRAEGEGALAVLRRMADQILPDLTSNAETERIRRQVLGRHPALAARALRELLAAEQALAEGFAADLGLDPGDLEPQVAATTAISAMRAAALSWFLSGAPPDRRPSMGEALDLVERGLGAVDAVNRSSAP